MFTLGQIAERLGIPLPQEHRNHPIRGLASLSDAGPENLSYIAEERYRSALASTRAAAVLVDEKIQLRPQDQPPGVILLSAPRVNLKVIEALEMLVPPLPRPAPGVHPSAVVDESASLGDDAAVGPNVAIGAGARIGRGCVLHAGVIIGDGATLGEECELMPNVVLRHGVTLGRRVVIHSGSVIGADGFGYEWDGQRHRKVPHAGGVVIDDDVEIGACSCVDRGKLGDTRIGAGTKIDNLVQVAHNVQIGRLCILVAQVGIAGSSRLGDGVIIGGNTGVRDHVSLGAGARVAACSAVKDDVPDGVTVVGSPAIPYRDFMRQQAAVAKLPELVERIRTLEKRLRATDSTGE